MKRTELPKRLQLLLHTTPYVTLATADASGQPWGTPLVGRFDENLNLYFVTAYRSQHGRNIRHNSRIFATIFNPAATLGMGEGLYFQMRAQILATLGDIQHAQHAAAMHFTEELPHHQALMGKCPRRLYKATAERIWYNDSQMQGGHELDVRREFFG